jgi:methylated-DNA-[protein]-cysteine S-methyltransferase
VSVTSFAYRADGWGEGGLWLQDDRLVWHELPRPHPSPKSRGRSAPMPAIVREVIRYFAGERVSFEDVDVDLDGLSPFQLALAAALRRVPYGEVVTYGELAALAGRPGAQRAAGTFCARNRYPLVVPCHRVVAAKGLGSYGDLGLDYKRRLLALEGVTF